MLTSNVHISDLDFIGQVLGEDILDKGEPLSKKLGYYQSSYQGKDVFILNDFSLDVEGVVKIKAMLGGGYAIPHKEGFMIVAHDFQDKLFKRGKMIIKLR